MPVTSLQKTTEFCCDICGTIRVEKNGTRWQERRLPYTRAKDAGWRFSRVEGRYQASCPDCTSTSGYSIEDILA